MASRQRMWTAVAVAAAVALVASACGRSAGGNAAAGNISATKGLVATTPAGAKPVPEITWAVYRDVNSLDPIFAFDYPENTAISLMCESLLRQAPDGSLQPGLATIANPSPTKMIFTLRPGVKFWDGHLVTSADVRVQPGPEHEPGARRVLQSGVRPGAVDPGHQSRRR